MLFLGIIVCFYLFYLFSYDKYDNNKIRTISDYLIVHNNMNTGTIDMLKNSDKVDITDDMVIRSIVSYLYYNGFYDASYNKDICSSCYKGFLDNDRVVFFKGDTVDNISLNLVGRVIKWNIYKDGDRSYNTLYYNKELNVYYIVVNEENKELYPVMKLKSFYKNGKVLNISYYYGYIKEELNDFDNSDNKISLFDIKNNLINSNSDLFVNNEFNFSKYNKNLNIIKYVFKWNKVSEVYELKELILEK